ncbi:MAG: YihY/virulence factor BrkB family protein [Chloroflexi bacterium]|nr:YihY/virulence factor BrkB family protein [Chloroflexota bacterium]
MNVQRLLRTYPGRLIQAYAGSQAGNYAGTVAFNAFISMFPLIAGIAAIIGLAVPSQQAQQQFISGATSFFPSDAANTLSSTLSKVHDASGILGIIGIVGFLWSGSSLFTTLEWVLGRMVGARQRSFLRQRAMTLVMTVIYLVAIVASIGLNSIVAIAHGLPFVGPVIGLLVWLAFFASVYRLVPNRTHALRQLWPGTLLAGILMEALTLLWPLYTGLSHNFSTYGETFALFFLLATWLYFLAQFMLLGAVANRMHAGEPDRGGLICTREPSDLHTEATNAADQFARRHAPAA